MNSKRKIGTLSVSPIGLGCMGMTHAFGAPSDVKEMTSLIAKAVEMGYTLFDTAECYTGVNSDGTTTYNEELVGKALTPYRNQIILATKGGVIIKGQHLEMDSRATTLKKSVEESLRKLRTDRIDLYYQHRIDPKVSPEEVAETMNELIKEGKILHWGVSEANEEYIRRAHAVCPLTAVQNRYSMMYRDYERLFPVLEELNIGFVAFSPLANGFLSACYGKNEKYDTMDYRRFMPQFSDKGVDENQKLLSLLDDVSESKNATPAQISLAWILAHKPYIVPIPGTRKLSRLMENWKSTEVELTPAEVKQIDDALGVMKMSAVFGGLK
jgi:aryl-alcohol dehydrogenase-like predicted oxidoreductase